MDSGFSMLSLSPPSPPQQQQQQHHRLHEGEDEKSLESLLRTSGFNLPTTLSVPSLEKTLKEVVIQYNRRGEMIEKMLTSLHLLSEEKKEWERKKGQDGDNVHKLKKELMQERVSRLQAVREFALAEQRERDEKERRMEMESELNDALERQKEAEDRENRCKARLGELVEEHRRDKEMGEEKLAQFLTSLPDKFSKANEWINKKGGDGIPHQALIQLFEEHGKLQKEMTEANKHRRALEEEITDLHQILREKQKELSSTSHSPSSSLSVAKRDNTAMTAAAASSSPNSLVPKAEEKAGLKTENGERWVSEDTLKRIVWEERAPLMAHNAKLKARIERLEKEARSREKLAALLPPPQAPMMDKGVQCVTVVERQKEALKATTTDDDKKNLDTGMDLLKRQMLIDFEDGLAHLRRSHFELNEFRESIIVILQKRDAVNFFHTGNFEMIDRSLASLDQLALEVNDLVEFERVYFSSLPTQYIQQQQTLLSASTNQKQLPPPPAFSRPAHSQSLPPPTNNNAAAEFKAQTFPSQQQQQQETPSPPSSALKAISWEIEWKDGRLGDRVADEGRPQANKGSQSEQKNDHVNSSTRKQGTKKEDGIGEIAAHLPRKRAGEHAAMASGGSSVSSSTTSSDVRKHREINKVATAAAKTATPPRSSGKRRDGSNNNLNNAALRHDNMKGKKRLHFTVPVADEGWRKLVEEEKRRIRQSHSENRRKQELRDQEEEGEQVEDEQGQQQQQEQQQEQQQQQIQDSTVAASPLVGGVSQSVVDISVSSFPAPYSPVERNDDEKKEQEQQKDQSGSNSSSRMEALFANQDDKDRFDQQIQAAINRGKAKPESLLLDSAQRNPPSGGRWMDRHAAVLRSFDSSVAEIKKMLEGAESKNIL